MRKGGERFFASGITTAMRNEADETIGFIKISRDMTKEQRAQESLIEARNDAEAANIAKTEFLANMSHEIRTPMNAIIGLSHILAMSQPLTPKQKEFVKTLQMSADSLLAHINDLLDISKIEARGVELESIPFSITEMVQEVVGMMAMRACDKGLTFTGKGYCVQNRIFLGDPTRLRQIVLNLCSNAVKFTEQGGVHYPSPVRRPSWRAWSWCVFPYAIRASGLRRKSWIRFSINSCRRIVPSIANMAAPVWGWPLPKRWLR